MNETNNHYDIIWNLVTTIIAVFIGIIIIISSSVGYENGYVSGNRDGKISAYNDMIVTSGLIYLQCLEDDCQRERAMFEKIDSKAEEYILEAKSEQ